MTKIYKHIETGNLYLVLGEIEMKNPETRKWAPGYLYKPLYGDLSRTYVRDKEDFITKFTEITDAIRLC